MKITIDIDPNDPRAADLLRKLADLAEGRAPEEVPARITRPQPKPIIEPATPSPSVPWVLPEVWKQRPCIWMVTSDHQTWC